MFHGFYEMWKNVTISAQGQFEFTPPLIYFDKIR